MYISEQAAVFVNKLSIEEIPENVCRTAKNSILDCLGVAVAGAREPASEMVTDLAAVSGGKPEATIIARNIKTASTEAAFVNATMAHALDFDDSTDTLGGHPTVVLLPAILALGQKLHASGRDVLEAYIAGFEVEAQLAKLVNFEHYDRGWHPTATLGVFGSAAACAKLLKLDNAKTAMALSIAVSLACGVKENFGTMTKPLHTGISSRNGLTAALLADKGFTAKKSAFEGKKGFFEVYNGPGNYRVENLEPLFGNPWDLAQPGVAIKQYPCCGSTHPAIDAVIHLVTQHDLSPSEIEKMQVATHPRRLAHTNRPLVQTTLEAKFSVQYVSAVAATNRWVGLDDFSDAAMKREAVQKMLSKVTAVPLPQDKWGPEHFAAEVDITSKDGRQLHHRVEKAKGRGPRLALSPAELERKFTDCVKRELSPETVQRCLPMIWELENLEDINGLMDCFAGQK
jgi:2-methylcitrate dehydratase PrpD